jgi:hypothetical protein
MTEVHPQLPRMNRYPQDKSIIVLDNCAIHKSEVLREVVNANGQLLIFLPPYSPDYNPIEESFSSGEYSRRHTDQLIDLWTVKAWIRRNWARMQHAEYPEIALLEAAHTVTPEKAREWYMHSGYTV